MKSFHCQRRNAVGWVGVDVPRRVIASSFVAKNPSVEGLRAILKENGLIFAKSLLTIIADEIPKMNVIFEIA
jgi:hypothetical protein